jgi:hypothetical protein
MELKIEKNKLKAFSPGESAVSLFALIVFLGTSWLILSKIEAINEDIPNYEKLTTNQYGNIEDLIGKDKSREIIETEQFRDLIYKDNLVKEYTKEKEGNLFKNKF